MTLYDPARVAAFFNASVEREDGRLADTLQGRIKYAIHRLLLEPERFRGQQVLDIGCGTGRFAEDLARCGARLTLADISEQQLSAAVARLEAAGLGSQIDRAVVADACDLSLFADGYFDAVVAFGAVLAYAYDRHLDALNEVVRVTRPGGLVAISVTGLWGQFDFIANADLAQFLVDWEQHLPDSVFGRNPDFLLTVPDSMEFHQPIVLFTARYLRRVVSDAGCVVLRTAASNPICLIGLSLPAINADERAAIRMTQLQLAMCELETLADTGDHIVMTARKALGR